MSHVSSGGGQDFELNLAPIIDCFTVLIAFIMVSASFASIGILDAGIAAGGETAQSATPPPVQFTVEIGTNHVMKVRVSGKENSTTPIAPVTGAEGKDWNHPALTSQLETLKKRWPTINGVTLVAENNVAYKDVVKNMEVIRKVIPSVLLGGF